MVYPEKKDVPFPHPGPKAATVNCQDEHRQESDSTPSSHCSQAGDTTPLSSLLRHEGRQAHGPTAEGTILAYLGKASELASLKARSEKKKEGFDLHKSLKPSLFPRQRYRLGVKDWALFRAGDSPRLMVVCIQEEKRDEEFRIRVMQITTRKREDESPTS